MNEANVHNVLNEIAMKMYWWIGFHRSSSLPRVLCERLWGPGQEMFFMRASIFSTLNSDGGILSLSTPTSNASKVYIFLSHSRSPITSLLLLNT